MGSNAQLLERAQAADAEHDLLADALVDIAAIELVGDVAVLAGPVLRDVGVEQVERDAADSRYARP